MATHTWFGANSGDWFSSTLWSGDTAPQPGDAVALNGGTVTLSGGEETVPVDGEDILLDGPGPAETVLQAATWGHSTTIDSSAGPVTLITDGASGDSGTIIASAAVSSFTIKATNGAFVLLNGGSIAVSNGDDLVLTGQFDTETGITVAAGSTLTNDGIDGEFGGITDVLSGAAGRPDPQLPDRQYNRSVSTAATSAFSSAARGLLKIDNGSSLIASLTMQGPPTGALATAPDGSAGTLITYPDSPIRASVEVDTAHVAVGANVVHQTPTTAAGAPVIGTGITIGIISDSFNATPNGIADPADTAARQSYLPQTASDTSAVDIRLDSNAPGVANEGLAMAERVHQIAPGAQIDCDTAEGGQQSFADGATIIVDDGSFSEERFYRIAGPVDTTIENAVSVGVSYFTAAGNQGDAYFESAWQPATDPGGIIDDPAAGQGSGSVHGHPLLPNVNAVGAAYWVNAPACNVPVDWTEFFSSAGPGALGSALTPDNKVDFVAPRGIETSATGASSPMPVRCGRSTPASASTAGKWPAARRWPCSGRRRTRSGIIEAASSPGLTQRPPKALAPHPPAPSPGPAMPTATPFGFRPRRDTPVPRWAPNH